MQCPECLSHNHSSATFCDQCGHALRGKVAARPVAPVVVEDDEAEAARSSSLLRMVILLLVVGGGGALAWYLINHETSRTEPAPAEVDSAKERTPSAPSLPPVDPSFVDTSEDSGPVVNSGVVHEEGVDTESRPADVPMLRKSSKSLPIGVVSFSDSWKSDFGRMPAAVLSGSWIALPRRACLGATEWKFQGSSGRRIDVSRGIWRTGDEVGLWQLGTADSIPQLDGPELMAWDPAEKLEWVPIAGEGKRQGVRVGRVRDRGAFRVFDPLDDVARPGVLVQGDRVVGWTFGQRGPSGVWLWSGFDGAELQADSTTDDFYRLTFAGGREEFFAKATARNAGLREVERVRAFVLGCRNLPKLTPRETPRRLTLAQVVLDIKTVVGQALRDPESGLAAAIVRLFDAGILVQAGDPQLMVVVATAEHALSGPASALDLLQGAGPDLLRPGSPDESIAIALEQKIYDEWLQQLVAEQRVDAGWNVYRDASERFPRTAVISLRGAQLALLTNDWREAERLLHSRQYPATLSDLVRVVQAEVSRLKGLEGKIVIRFTPGANIIPTTATINGRLEQDFMVDTGATRTTIPASIISQLGLSTSGAPRVRVSTAGGIITVPQITVDSITLGGWEVRDVEVLVLDLPGTPNLGLIGLNFLRNFRMDLKVDEGILTLEPK